MEISQLCQDYLDKIPTKDLQKKYNLSWKKLTKILKENNIYQKSNSLKTEEHKLEYLKNNYFLKSNKDLAKILNLSEDWIRILAKKLNLPPKKSGWKYNNSIENLNYNSNEFYYFLGWIASDGNVSKNLQQIRICITDLEILKNFQKIFKETKIKHYPKEKQKDLYLLYICSKKLGTYLNSIGITPNKSKNLNVCESLWNSHFVRGFFEGDGHVRKTSVKDRYTRYSVGFVSNSELFSLRLQKYFFDNKIFLKIKKEKNYFRLNIEGKEQVKLFYNLIYNNCDIWYLKRKKQILDQLFSNE